MAQETRCEPTGRPARRVERPVGDQDGGTEAGEGGRSRRCPARAASNRLRLIGVPKRMAGSANTGRASRPATPRSEKAVRPPTASPASMPLVASIRNCTAAPAAAPPGMIRLMELPASWAVTTGNQALVRRRDPLEREGAGEVGRLGDHGGSQPDEVDAGQLGKGGKDGDDLRRHEIQGHAGNDDDDGPLDHCLPRERARLVGALTARGSGLVRRLRDRRSRKAAVTADTFNHVSRSVTPSTRSVVLLGRPAGGPGSRRRRRGRPSRMCETRATSASGKGVPDEARSRCGTPGGIPTPPRGWRSCARRSSIRRPSGSTSARYPSSSRMRASSWTCSSSVSPASRGAGVVESASPTLLEEVVDPVAVRDRPGSREARW